MSIVKGILMICCPRRRSDAVVNVGASRADLLGVCLGSQGVREVMVDPGSGNALCPVGRVPPSGVGLPAFD